MNNERDFEKWLSNNVQKEKTVTQYIRTLREIIPKELTKIGKENYQNLLDCSEVSYIESIYNSLLSGGDLHTFNLNTQKMLPSAAIKKYLDFLKETTLQIKNIMLYGVPGVGKTYNHKRLISLIEGGQYSQSDIFDSIENNKDLKSEDLFKKVEKEGRIRFVTFHQSYSYEDFIEGYRPDEESDNKLIRKDGFFKEIAEKAKNNLEKSQISNSKDSIFTIKHLIELFQEYVSNFIDNEKEFILGGKITITSISEKGSFCLGGSIKTQRLTTELIERDYSSFQTGKIKSYQDIKPKHESQRNFHGNARYYFMLLQKIKEFEKTLKKDEVKVSKEELKNYYLVIDEINRGNISKIFGELITLIEEDKRDNLSIELPYSRDKFTVPSNLYIIGTMNTSDKSIALLDIALRRRFTFLKLEPLEAIVPEIAKDFFKKLNQEIEKLRGEDYLIGHGYFTNIKNENDFEFVKKYQILPLLEEYLYGDDENLKRVKKKFF